MRFLATIFLCVLLTHSANAYWQQKVDHKIRVSLDDQNHILRGFQEMVYTNNSPDTLEYIFMHLYPNAYKHDHTAFAKQKVESGDTKFYFSDKYEKGFIDSLEFRVDNLPLNFSKYNDNEDIVFLELVEPILPGESITIETPFRVVIPKTFSRLGHMGQSYQITQWYPKPAVYDKEGWHMMPYLDQGEFFYEYGDYDVEITLPEKYVVASTGDMIFNAANAMRTSSEVSKKAVRFLQKNVHDFAWFADKTFKVHKEEFELPSGRKCTAYAYYTPVNEKKYKTSAKALVETTKYLSKQVGEYPYNQISIVDGPLYAGGGMEYPNVAIIGSLPDEETVNIVIAHEAGHNWFQGILGSNERIHPWLDEGVNSFYEAKIVERLKEKKIPVAASGGNGIIYQLNGHIHHDQPIEFASAEYTDENYGGVVYAKAAKAMAFLEDYMGGDNFKAGMKQYFNTWKQKHPSPTDLRAALERNTNQDISWFFKDFIKSGEPLDYKINSVITEGANKVVRVEDKFGSAYPVPVFAMKGDSVLQKSYSQNGEAFFNNYNSEVYYKIDNDGVLPEINKENNSYKTTGLFKRKNPSIGIGTSFLKPGQNNAYILPAVAYNHYDRWMAGIVFHNLELPNKKFQFALAPLYSFKSKQLNGTGVIGYSFYPKSKIYRVTASVQGSAFSQDSILMNLPEAIYHRYYKINPRLKIELQKPSLRSPIERSIVLNYFHVGFQDRFNFSTDTITKISTPSVADYEQRNIFRVNYIHNNNRTFNPFGYNFQYESTKDISKLSVEGNLKVDYFMPNKALQIRAFAGKFFYLNNEASFFDIEPYFFNVTPTAVNDYAYENTFIGRSERDGYHGQQVMYKEGGFGTRTTYLSNPLGRSDDWLVSVNLKSDIPLKYKFLPQVFFNIASFGDAGMTNPSGNKTLYEGGLQFNLLDELIKINIPLVLSKDFKDYTKSIYNTNRFARQISFTLSTDKIDFLRTQERLTKLVF